jgi:hypothetical protein
VKVDLAVSDTEEIVAKYQLWWSVNALGMADRSMWMIYVSDCAKVEASREIVKTSEHPTLRIGVAIGEICHSMGIIFALYSHNAHKFFYCMMCSRLNHFGRCLDTL